MGADSNLAVARASLPGSEGSVGLASAWEVPQEKVSRVSGAGLRLQVAGPLGSWA